MLAAPPAPLIAVPAGPTSDYLPVRAYRRDVPGVATLRGPHAYLPWTDGVALAQALGLTFYRYRTAGGLTGLCGGVSRLTFSTIYLTATGRRDTPSMVGGH